MDRITSRRNPLVADALKVRRRKSDRILIEGPQLVVAALDAGLSLMRIFSVEDSPLGERSRDLGEVTLVSPDVMELLADTKNPRGPVAVTKRPDPVLVRTDTVFVLWDVQDPGNVGTLIRTAAVLGLGVIVTGASADPWGSKTLRASAGGCFAAPVEQSPKLAIADLSDRGYTTVGLVTSGGAKPEDLPIDHRLALLIGSEAHGLPVGVTEEVDLLTTIPMVGWAGSLNAAAAGAIAGYLASRNARGRQRGSD